MPGGKLFQRLAATAQKLFNPITHYQNEIRELAATQQGYHTVMQMAHTTILQLVEHQNKHALDPAQEQKLAERTHQYALDITLNTCTEQDAIQKLQQVQKEHIAALLNHEASRKPMYPVLCALSAYRENTQAGQTLLNSEQIIALFRCTEHYSTKASLQRHPTLHHMSLDPADNNLLTLLIGHHIELDGLNNPQAIETLVTAIHTNRDKLFYPKESIAWVFQYLYRINPDRAMQLYNGIMQPDHGIHDRTPEGRLVRFQLNALMLTKTTGKPLHIEEAHWAMLFKAMCQDPSIDNLPWAAWQVLQTNQALCKANRLETDEAYFEFNAAFKKDPKTYLAGLTTPPDTEAALVSMVDCCVEQAILEAAKATARDKAQAEAAIEARQQVAVSVAREAINNAIKHQICPDIADDIMEETIQIQTMLQDMAIIEQATSALGAMSANTEKLLSAMLDIQGKEELQQKNLEHQQALDARMQIEESDADKAKATQSILQKATEYHRSVPQTIIRYYREQIQRILAKFEEQTDETVALLTAAPDKMNGKKTLTKQASELVEKATQELGTAKALDPEQAKAQLEQTQQALEEATDLHKKAERAVVGFYKTQTEKVMASLEQQADETVALLTAAPDKMNGKKTLTKQASELVEKATQELSTAKALDPEQAKAQAEQTQKTLDNAIKHHKETEQAVVAFYQTQTEQVMALLEKQVDATVALLHTAPADMAATKEQLTAKTNEFVGQASQESSKQGSLNPKQAKAQLEQTQQALEDATAHHHKAEQAVVEFYKTQTEQVIASLKQQAGATVVLLAGVPDKMNGKTILATQANKSFNEAGRLSTEGAMSSEQAKAQAEQTQNILGNATEYHKKVEAIIAFHKSTQALRNITAWHTTPHPGNSNNPAEAFQKELDTFSEKTDETAGTIHKKQQELDRKIHQEKTMGLTKKVFAVVCPANNNRLFSGKHWNQENDIPSPLHPLHIVLDTFLKALEAATNDESLGNALKELQNTSPENELTAWGEGWAATLLDFLQSLLDWFRTTQQIQGYPKLRCGHRSDAVKAIQSIALPVACA